MTQTGVVVGALVRRALNEILRVPGAAIPGVLAPTIFMIGLSAVFGEAAQLRGFEADSFREFIVPVGMLQGAAFTGAAMLASISDIASRPGSSAASCCSSSSGVSSRSRLLSGVDMLCSFHTLHRRNIRLTR